jgi:hypothetical protein
VTLDHDAVRELIELEIRPAVSLHLTGTVARTATWHMALNLMVVSLFTASWLFAAQLRSVPYVGPVLTQARRTSATLQAWATHPRGANGSSASKISLMEPMQASSR